MSDPMAFPLLPAFCVWCVVHEHVYVHLSGGSGLESSSMTLLSFEYRAHWYGSIFVFQILN